MATAVNEIIENMGDELIDIRRDLHIHPELSFEEHRTARIIAERLDALGLEVRTGVGGTGVVALLRGGRPGKTVALRADIDALPIVELNEAPYRSQVEGIMHACGHDGHVAGLLGAAEALHATRESLNGDVLLIFQPAEERAGGAKPMIDAGALRDPRPDAVFGVHIWNNLPAGVIGVKPGPIFAAADEVEITIKAPGGHGAMPHQTVDPITVSAQVIQALQTLVSRETSPFDSTVVSICSVHGGNAFNIIPSEVRLLGTVRTFDEHLQARMKRRIEEMVRAIAQGAGADYGFRYDAPCPPVINDATLAEFIRTVAEDEFGVDRVVTPLPTTGGDDMSYFLKEVPGVYFFVGGANADRGLNHPHHNARFDFDEIAVTATARILARAAVEYLEQRL
ncbi:MAG TPA: amidohydrolase [Chloroflexota bacterium]|nr:amidohydrolase [Chloroflexota bacterium]